MVSRRARHVFFMALAMVALFTGLWSGLLRLGWPWPMLSPTVPLNHGPLMVSGFFGTLIGLERAAALGRGWAYAAPLATAGGAVALLMGLPGGLGPSLMAVGSLVFMVGTGVIVRRQPALFTITLGLGALAWCVGNGLWWAGWPIYRVVPWWAGFLVLTIAGERLELSRVLMPTYRAQAAFLCVTGMFVCGLGLGLVFFDPGMRLTGTGMLALAFWLLHYDLARRTVQRQGLPRFTAICLLSGYLWLGISGMLGLLFGGVIVGPSYDAMWHSLFLGFVVAMIFGHAPIIFPAILDKALPFRQRFYVHLGLLQLSLLLRLVGDLAAWGPGRQWGGLFNAVAIIVFLANTVQAMRTSQ